MCGRFALAIDAKSLERRFSIQEPLREGIVPRYNIAPTQEVPVLLNPSQRQWVLLRWGLIPHWAYEEKKSLINSRVETCLKVRPFLKLLQTQRCLAPATGFFEWKDQIPYYIYLPQQPIFALGGIWDVWRKPNGQIIHSFSILTQPASEGIEKLHSRMPLVIPQEKEVLWLSENPRISIQDFYQKKNWLYYPISLKVNNPKNDFPELLSPLPPDPQISLF
jgi:putative SOS response-associated peptidase YedK